MSLVACMLLRLNTDSMVLRMLSPSNELSVRRFRLPGGAGLNTPDAVPASPSWGRCRESSNVGNTTWEVSLLKKCSYDEKRMDSVIVIYQFNKVIFHKLEGQWISRTIYLVQRKILNMTWAKKASILFAMTLKWFSSDSWHVITFMWLTLDDVPLLTMDLRSFCGSQIQSIILVPTPLSKHLQSIIYHL